MYSEKVIINTSYLQLLIKHAKILKSTFICNDCERIFGMNGEVLSNGDADIGVLKWVDFDNIVPRTEYNPYTNPINMSFMSKDLIVIEKFLTPDIDICMHFYKDEISGRVIRTSPLYVNNTIEISRNPIDISKYIWMKNTYANLMCGELPHYDKIISNMDITNHQDVVDIINMKADKGGGFVRINGCVIFMIANVMNITKNDTISLDVWNYNDTQYIMLTVDKKSKHCKVRIMYRILIWN